MVEIEGKHFTLVAVVAMARNRVIGMDGAMPWRLPSDLKHYRRATMGRPMIMGRRTLEAIGRTLDGRDSIVLTRAQNLPVEGAIIAGDREEALRIAARCARARETNEIVIVGGAQIYSLFLDVTDRIEMTIVEADPAGDTYFPEIDKATWQSTASAALEPAAGDSAPAHIVTLTRR